MLICNKKTNILSLIFCVNLMAVSLTSQADETEDFLIEKAKRSGFTARVYSKNKAADLIKEKMCPRYYINMPKISGESVIFLTDYYQQTIKKSKHCHNDIVAFFDLNNDVKRMKTWYENNPLSPLNRDFMYPFSVRAANIWLLMLPHYQKKPLITLSFNQQRLSSNSFIVNPDLTVNFHRQNTKEFFLRPDTPDVVLYVANRIVYLSFKQQQDAFQSADMIRKASLYNTAIKTFIGSIQAVLIHAEDTYSDAQDTQQLMLTSIEDQSDTTYLLPSEKGLVELQAVDIQNTPEACTYMAGRKEKWSPLDLNENSSLVLEVLHLMASATQIKKYTQDYFSEQADSVQVDASSESEWQQKLAKSTKKMSLLKLTDSGASSGCRTIFDRNVDITKQLHRSNGDLMRLIEGIEEMIATMSDEDDTSLSDLLSEQLTDIDSGLTALCDQPSFGTTSGISEIHIIAYLIQRTYEIKRKLKVTHKYAKETQYKENLKKLISLEVGELSDTEMSLVKNKDLFNLSSMQSFPMENISETSHSIKLLKKRFKAFNIMQRSEKEALIRKQKGLIETVLLRLQHLHGELMQHQETRNIMMLKHRVKIDSEAILALLFSKSNMHIERQTGKSQLAAKIIDVVVSTPAKAKNHLLPETVLSWNEQSLRKHWEKSRFLKLTKAQNADFFLENTLFILNCLKTLVRDYNSNTHDYRGSFITQLQETFSLNQRIKEDLWLAFEHQAQMSIPTQTMSSEARESLANAPGKFLIARATELVGLENFEKLSSGLAVTQEGTDGHALTTSDVTKKKEQIEGEELSLLLKQTLVDSQWNFADTNMTVQLPGTNNQLSISSPLLRAIESRKVASCLVVLGSKRQRDIQLSKAARFNASTPVDDKLPLEKYVSAEKSVTSHSLKKVPNAPKFMGSNEPTRQQRQTSTAQNPKQNAASGVMAAKKPTQQQQQQQKQTSSTAQNPKQNAATGAMGVKKPAEQQKQTSTAPEPKQNAASDKKSGGGFFGRFLSKKK